MRPVTIISASAALLALGLVSAPAFAQSDNDATAKLGADGHLMLEPDGQITPLSQQEAGLLLQKPVALGDTGTTLGIIERVVVRGREPYAVVRFAPDIDLGREVMPISLDLMRRDAEGIRLIGFDLATLADYKDADSLAKWPG